MTDRPAEDGPGAVARLDQGNDAVLAGALQRARWTILWERLWPALATVATAIGLFLAVSWLGLWLWLPPVGRAIGLGVFFLLTAAAFAPFLHAAHADPHRGPAAAGPQYPACRIGRRPPLPTISRSRPTTRLGGALARAYRARLAGRQDAQGRSADAAARRRDPFALRALVLLLVIATFVAAGGERLRRIAAAFDWQGVMLPPISARRLGEPADLYRQAAGDPAGPAARRAGSARNAGPRCRCRPAACSSFAPPARCSSTLSTDGLAVDRSSAAEGPRAQAAKGTDERRFVINDAGSATVRGVVASDVTWQFTAIPDRPPTIALTKDPEVQGRGNLQALLQARGRLRRRRRARDLQAQGRAAPTAIPPRSLFEAPDFPLALPQARTRNGVGQTTKDLTEHPWAGANGR